MWPTPTKLQSLSSAELNWLEVVGFHSRDGTVTPESVESKSLLRDIESDTTELLVDIIRIFEPGFLLPRIHQLLPTLSPKIQR